MSQRIIPARTEIRCDVCGIACVGWEYKMKTQIKVSMNALDHLGDPACSAGYTIDLCDKCAREFDREYRPRG